MSDAKGIRRFRTPNSFNLSWLDENLSQQHGMIASVELSVNDVDALVERCKVGKKQVDKHIIDRVPGQTYNTTNLFIVRFNNARFTIELNELNKDGKSAIYYIKREGNARANSNILLPGQ